MTETHQSKQGICEDCGYEGTVYNNPSEGYSLDDYPLCQGCKQGAYDVLLDSKQDEIKELEEARDLFLGNVNY